MEHGPSLRVMIIEGSEPPWQYRLLHIADGKPVLN
jgi:hypothetical protein